MLPEKLQEAIKQIKIVNEINNSYVYLSFTEEEINTLKEKCQTIIKEIKHYENNLRLFSLYVLFLILSHKC